MTDGNAMYEVEDFEYCKGCIHAMTGECDTCDDGSKHTD